MKQLGWLSLSIWLLLISGAAFASGADPSISANAVTNHSDLSVSYLGQIFGSMGNVLQGTSGQMLGKLLYEFNFGILIITAVWAAGTTFIVTLRTATEGSFMGQNNKVPMVIFRVAFGTILLMPNVSLLGGYSMGQYLLMKVVVTGAELGDMVWDYGLNYISDGGQLWVTPTTNDNSSTKLLDDDSIYGSSGSSVGNGILGQKTVGSDKGSLAPKAQLGLAQRIFASEVCMVASSIQWQQQSRLAQDQSPDSGVAVSDTGSLSAYHFIEDDTNNVILFPGMGDDPNNLPTTWNPSKSNGINCGYVAWDGVPGTIFDPNDANSCQKRVNSTMAGGQHASGSHCEFSRLAVLGMVNDMLPAAKSFACNQYAGINASTTPVCTGVNYDNSQFDNDIVTAMYNGVLNFANTITPLANSQYEKFGGNSSLSFIGPAEKAGWLSAGRFYWDLVHAESLTQKITQLNTYVPQTVNLMLYGDPTSSVIMSPREDTVVTPAYGSGTQTSVVGQTVDKFYTSLSHVPGWTDGYTQAVVTQLTNEGQASSTGDGGDGADTTPTAGNKVLNAFIPLIGDIQRLKDLFTNDAIGPDPILFLHNVGTLCLNLAGEIWLAPLGSIIGILMTAYICSGESPVGFALSQAIDWIRPIFMALAAAFMGCGALLAIYLPLYPYIIWTCSLLGCFYIPVIEAMVAIPIVALGITNSQGHDIWGRAEVAINIFLLLLIRPTLLVIGFIASMILSFVALKMVIYGFTGVAHDLFTSGYQGDASGIDVKTASIDARNAMLNSSGSIGGVVAQLLVLPLFLMTFSFVVWDVTIQCYKLTYMLGNVISYINGRQENHGIDNMMNSIQQSISGVGSKIGQGMVNTPSLMKPVANGNNSGVEAK